VGVAGFVALERLLRQPGSASSLEASGDDDGTTRRIVAAYLLAAALPALLRWVPQRPLPAASGPMGVAMEAAGLVLRAWSMLTLGAAYSRTLRTEAAQGVVEAGPYRRLRHPGYLGSLTTWVGFALTSRSLAVVVTVAGLLAAAYRRRIAAEEELLRRDLPGYLAYSRRTRKLVPFLW
jgi:protein-S-isoprenylcysteine O-methyltransferase